MESLVYKCDIQMKATEQHFPVVLFIMLHKVILYFWVCGWNPCVTIQTEAVEQ